MNAIQIIMAESLKDSILAWELKESKVDLLISKLNTIYSIIVPEVKMI